MGKRRRAMRGWGMLVLGVALLGVAVVIAACSGEAGAKASVTPSVGGATVTVPSQTGTGAGPMATPSITPITAGGVATGPSGDVCQGVRHVAAQLPASIPAYPRGELRLAELARGSGLFGICTSDAPSVVAHFYLSELPAKGWGEMQTDSISTTQLITATHGEAHLSITIQPDPLVEGKTQIVVQAMGL